MLQDNYTCIRKMNTVDLQQRGKEKEEYIQKLEEEIRKVTTKNDTLTETNETSDLIEDRKSSLELRKQLLQEIQMYTPTNSHNQEGTQSRHSGKTHTPLSPTKKSKIRRVIMRNTLEKPFTPNVVNFLPKSMISYL